MDQTNKKAIARAPEMLKLIHSLQLDEDGAFTQKQIRISRSLTWGGEDTKTLKYLMEQGEIYVVEGRGATPNKYFSDEKKANASKANASKLTPAAEMLKLIHSLQLDEDGAFTQKQIRISDLYPRSPTQGGELSKTVKDLVEQGEIYVVEGRGATPNKYFSDEKKAIAYRAFGLYKANAYKANASKLKLAAEMLKLIHSLQLDEDGAFTQKQIRISRSSTWGGEATKTLKYLVEQGEIYVIEGRGEVPHKYFLDEKKASAYARKLANELLPATDEQILMVFPGLQLNKDDGLTAAQIFKHITPVIGNGMILQTTEALKKREALQLLVDAGDLFFVEELTIVTKFQRLIHIPAKYFSSKNAAEEYQAKRAAGFVEALLDINTCPSIAPSSELKAANPGEEFVFAEREKHTGKPMGKIVPLRVGEIDAVMKNRAHLVELLDNDSEEGKERWGQCKNRLKIGGAEGEWMKCSVYLIRVVYADGNDVERVLFYVGFSTSGEDRWVGHLLAAAGVGHKPLFVNKAMAHSRTVKYSKDYIAEGVSLKVGLAIEALYIAALGTYHHRNSPFLDGLNRNRGGRFEPEMRKMLVPMKENGFDVRFVPTRAYVTAAI